MKPIDAMASPDAAYAIANQLLVRHGRSFHWARRLLGADHAERATRLYGFCRRIDNLADEATSQAEAHAALDAVRRALRNGESDNVEVRDMQQLMYACRIDSSIPLELIEGIESDLGEVRFVDVDELINYCYRVAGTVGLMMTAVLDVRDPEALPHAIDLGIAMQLTNICRDVRDDALMGRRYLPASLVGDITPESLIDPVAAVRAKACQAVASLLELADRFYASGEHGLRFLPPGARTGILVAARVYRAIGFTLRRRHYDCWSARVVVGKWGKTVVTLRALADTVRVRRRGVAHAHAMPHAGLPRQPDGVWLTEIPIAD